MHFHQEIASATEFGVYVHVPYCRERCSYCDFALTPVGAGGAPSKEFADAAVREIETVAPPVRDLSLDGKRPISVYFGGGTPSMLEPADVARILAAVDRRFGLGAVREITLEANPEDAEPKRLAGFRAAGVTRLTLGVQALEDRFLRALSRAHDAAQARAAIAAARAAGFAEVAVDLMFGAEGMRVDDWRATLDAAVVTGATHLSCYGLTLEGGTAMQRLVEKGSLVVPDDDAQADMYELAVERLGAHGFPRYEISNFAAPAHEAVHNNLYWRYQEWLGIGPSSHSALRVPGGAVRWWNEKNPFRWLEDGARVGGSERVTGGAAMGEMAFTGLRLARGLAARDFDGVFGEKMFERALGAVVAKLEAMGLARRTADGVALTDRGFLISDSVFRQIVDMQESQAMRGVDPNG